MANYIEDNITYEVCPHCDEEVKLPNTLGVHKCPNCGKYIVSCSMCLINNHCKDCILCIQAENMNKCGDEAVSLGLNTEITEDLLKEMAYLKSKLTDKFSECYIDYAKNTKAVGVCLRDDRNVELMLLVKQDDDLTTKIETKTVPIVNLLYTDFLDEVHECLDGKKPLLNFDELYKKAYQESNLLYGEYPYRTIFCDERDMVTCKGFNKFVREVRLYTNHNITFVIGESTITKNFNDLDLDTYNKLNEILDRKEKIYEFSGEVTVFITRVYGKGRTFNEAKANAMMEAENELTFNGYFETRINDIDKDFSLEEQRCFSK